ncbi:Uncharacterised protein [Escherichia coli]|uniref:Uncharacterized protein n=1 Tax=Escherichia coli TaxID=562 RepID=A0A376TPX0_ECOLX|nr:Uncharacterised protein [Escherichia coli]
MFKLSFRENHSRPFNLLSINGKLIKGQVISGVVINHNLVILTLET